MLYTPRVFISHSAKEPEAASLCQALARRFTQAGFEVLWDSHLQASQSWRAVIDEWIWKCDAAVLVLSEAATKSRFVAYEVALLRQRWRYGLPLVPIWCPNVTENVLTDRMGALQLAEIQTILKFTAWPAVFDGVAQQVENLLKPLVADTRARHEIEEQLIHELNFGTRTEAALVAISKKYGLPTFPPGGKDDLALALARHMLDYPAPLGEQRFSHLAVGVSTMKTVLAEAVRVPRIVNLVAPFCWVSPEGAIRVAGLFALPAGQPRAIAWRRSWCHAEKMYLHRGFCVRDRTRLYIAKASDAAGGTSEAILDHVRAIVASEVCHRRDAGVAQVAARIKSLSDQGRPVFLVLPARALDAALLDKILGQWPLLCVFLYADKAEPVNLKEQFPRVPLLEPPLAPAEEESARTGWGDCMAEADPLADLEAETAFL